MFCVIKYVFTSDGVDIEDSELDMEVDSSTDMVARLFRLSISNGVLCLPAGPHKVEGFHK